MLFLTWRPGIDGPLILFLAASLVVARLAPGLLPLWFGAPIATIGLLLVATHLRLCWCLWLIIAGLSAEMTLLDLVGPEMFQITIAAVKGAEITLVGLTILRHGGRFDRFNPVFGFLWIGVGGFVAGVHPELTTPDMLRSLAGSVVPFLPFFCRIPAGWGRAMQRAVCYAPLTSCAIGGVLAVLGLRPLFVDTGGLRLAALGHPAFLAGVCLPAIHAGLLRWLRQGATSDGLLMGTNLLILVLTGARAPITYGFLVCAVALLFAPDTAVPRSRRLVMALMAVASAPIVASFGEDYTSLRLFTILSSEASDLSGRDLLWPAFEAAAAEAPWLGWGLGAGNVVIPHQSQLVQLVQTWAAHNEYLRIAVEGGQIGRGVLIALFLAWVWSHTRRMERRDRFVLRVIFLAHAAHAMTDNVLISTPACVFFGLFAAISAQAEPVRLPVRRAIGRRVRAAPARSPALPVLTP
jgi:O-antigen ligase